jgi:hypothetical protein
MESHTSSAQVHRGAVQHGRQTQGLKSMPKCWSKATSRSMLNSKVNKDQSHLEVRPHLGLGRPEAGSL